MDACSFNINTAREIHLRRHLREVLLPYVRAHLTSDHVAFTEMAVEELLLQALQYVPLADATSFLLPTEPFEILIRSMHSHDINPPEEKWATPSEHYKYLRTIFPPPPHPQDLPTEKCWFEDDHYIKLSLMRRPISTPILSKRSRRETPNFGSTHSRESIPRTMSALTAFLKFRPVSVQSVDNFPAPPGIDGSDPVSCRDLRVKLDSATDALVRPFLRSVSVAPKRGKSVDSLEDTPHVARFLDHDSPSRYPPSLNSPPLFPRSAKNRFVQRSVRGAAKSGTTNPTRVSDLASMLKVASPELIDGEDGDINDYHMEVASGWSALRFSSPSPPSQHSSDGSEVDELWDISPPGTPATSLMAVKMDEVEIPRVRKFGHKNTLVSGRTNNSGATALLAVGTSPGFFITSFISAPILIPQNQKPITSQLESVGFGVHLAGHLSPGQNTSISLLGQPPSAIEEETNVKSAGTTDGLEDLEQFDDAVASIYVSTLQDPLSYFIEEKLDDKDMMLMDVPNLPPLTTHPKNPILFPEAARCFVAPEGEFSRFDTASHGIHTVGTTAFLRPVKGIKPLALDLSWRPFNFGRTIPTDEEVAGIAKPIQPDIEVLGYRDERFEETAGILLDLYTPPTSAEDALLPTRGCQEFGTSPAPKRAEESRDVEYLLTRRERMQASRSNLTPEVEVEVHDDITEPVITPRRLVGGHGDILVQHESVSHCEEHQDSGDSLDFVECYSRNRNDHSRPFDDLGIDTMNDTFAQHSTSEFGVPLPLQLHQGDLLHDVGTPSGNGNVDDQGDNKENVPPGDVDNNHLAEYQPDPPDTQYDWSGYFEFPESEGFEPLSFPSQSQLLAASDDLANSKVHDAPPLTPAGRLAEHPSDRVVPTSECDLTNSRATKRRKLDDLVPASSKDLFSAFIGLRNQATSNDRALEHIETRNDAPTPHHMQDTSEKILPRGTPNDVFDQHTVRLPEPWITAAAIHRYLASMAFIQKRALVRALQGHHCRVDLVERYDLGGADIIVDPDSSVLFVPLLALPAHLESTAERISSESWHYLHLLVVLEAFPSVQSYKADRSRDNGSVPYAYTPPVCKAIKKLRRYLGIAEGCDTLNPRCTITWAFANDIDDAAKFVRCFGEEMRVISNERGRGILWDEREWLEEEEREGEPDLAGVRGMNAFAAFVMLYDRSLDIILDLSPEARLADFGQLLGEERMTMLNVFIESRKQQIATDTADSVLDPAC